MPYLRRISERHQITIPPNLLAEAGIPEGALVSIVAEGGRIILEPKQLADPELEKEDWAALDSLVAEQKTSGAYAEFSDPASAKKHFKKPKK
ncbi:MAG: AbrB/MazE/SpoVT family DNA-binding domain-containing protein [Elusimicrobiota bacterium]